VIKFDFLNFELKKFHLNQKDIKKIIKKNTLSDFIWWLLKFDHLCFIGNDLFDDNLLLVPSEK
jgi:hypothetical protein